MSNDFVSDFRTIGTQQAPCKINLTLDVFPPRADGFHDLDSIVLPCLPADEVRIDIRLDTHPNIALICNDPSLPTDAKNLAYRAAALFAELRDLGNYGIQIFLEKRLPHQAGLGGGSSDAATVLALLAAYFPIQEQLFAEPSKLAEIAARIGSDVPLFLQKGFLRMQGRGEIIESLYTLIRPKPAPPVPLYGVLVKPHVGVPTGPAYQLLDAIPDRVPGQATEQLIDVLKKTVDPYAIADALGNDFEQAVLPAFPEVAATHQAVTDAGALRALLCGSGSAIFGLARDRDHAETMAKTLRDQNRYSWVEVAESIP